jgi:hypothetical protein
MSTIYKVWACAPATREDLLSFAARAERFVAALIARQEKENTACERAIEAVERTTARVD